MATLAVLAVAATAGIAYGTATQRLNSEVDQMLIELAAQSRQGSGIAPGDFHLPRRDQGPGRSDLSLQVLDEGGVVVDQTGDTEVAVSEEDVAIAAAGSGSGLRSAGEGDRFYRVMTVGLEGGGAIQLVADTTDTIRVLAAFRRRFIGVAVGVVAVAMVAGWVIARQVTRPLEILTGTAERIARTGELSAPIATGGADETGRLAQAFAAMVEALRVSRGQQQQLVEDAGHELRTPLTSLRTNLSILERHPDLADPGRAALLADLRTEFVELSNLVDEVLSLAADRRDEEPRQEIELASIVARVGDRLQRRSGRSVLVTGAGSTVTGPPTGIERAVANLIDNAAKFSPSGTPIEVELTGVGLAVRDHGPGIDPLDLDQVFDRFYRAAAARSLPGSGLGLAIVRQVVENAGGRVFARNHSEGGAVVGFELPPVTA